MQIFRVLDLAPLYNAGNDNAEGNPEPLQWLWAVRGGILALNPRTPYNGFGRCAGDMLGTRMGMGKCGTTVPIYYKWQICLHFPSPFLHLDLWGNALFVHFPKGYLHLDLWGNAL